MKSQKQRFKYDRTKEIAGKIPTVLRWYSGSRLVPQSHSRRGSASRSADCELGSSCFPITGEKLRQRPTGEHFTTFEITLFQKKRKPNTVSTQSLDIAGADQRLNEGNRPLGDLIPSCRVKMERSQVNIQSSLTSDLSSQPTHAILHPTPPQIESSRSRSSGEMCGLLICMY